MGNECGWDGVDRRTGDTWRRHIHGWVEEVDGRVKSMESQMQEGRREMSALAAEIRSHDEASRHRDGLIAGDIRRSIEQNADMLRKIDPIAAVFVDPAKAKRMMDDYGNVDGTRALGYGFLKFLALVGAAAGGVGVLIMAVKWLAHP